MDWKKVINKALIGALLAGSGASTVNPPQTLGEALQVALATVAGGLLNGGINWWKNRKRV